MFEMWLVSDTSEITTHWFATFCIPYPHVAWNNENTRHKMWYTEANFANMRSTIPAMDNRWILDLYETPSCKQHCAEPPRYLSSTTAHRWPHVCYRKVYVGNLTLCSREHLFKWVFILSVLVVVYLLQIGHLMVLVGSWVATWRYHVLFRKVLGQWGHR